MTKEEERMTDNAPAIIDIPGLLTYQEQAPADPRANYAESARHVWSTMKAIAIQTSARRDQHYGEGGYVLTDYGLTRVIQFLWPNQTDQTLRSTRDSIRRNLGRTLAVVCLTQPRKGQGTWWVARTWKPIKRLEHRNEVIKDIQEYREESPARKARVEGSRKPRKTTSNGRKVISKPVEPTVTFSVTQEQVNEFDAPLYGLEVAAEEIKRLRQENEGLIGLRIELEGTVEGLTGELSVLREKINDLRKLFS